MAEWLRRYAQRLMVDELVLITANGKLSNHIWLSCPWRSPRGFVRDGLIVMELRVLVGYSYSGTVLWLAWSWRNFRAM